MNYPLLNRIPRGSERLEVFQGYNHNLRIGDGEFFDMENLTSDRFPVLSPRGRRGFILPEGEVTGMIAKDSLCYTAGSKFYMNGYGVDLGLNEQPKQMVSMGAYVIILPDKKWINTMDVTQFGDIEAQFESHSDVSFSLCAADGTSITVDYIGSEAPASPQNMQYWLDTSGESHSLKQWSGNSSMWVSVATTYVRIGCAGIGAAFELFDGIFIEGLADSRYEDLKALNGAAIVWNKDDDYIVVVGLLDAQRTVSTAVKVSRTMPNMDFVTESNNRLWGCRYGLSKDGEVVNELYACKLGDFKNWNCFMGISTDSYAVSLGTDGVFTGAITHQGYPLFFKENCLHKVYGQIPSNFQVQTTSCRGVQKGSEKSLAIVNEVLYYKANHGICAYDGSLPVDASSALGDVRYFEAVGAAFRNKYYVSMVDASGEPSTFVYDTAKGMWHREDDRHISVLCGCRDDLYAYGEGKLMTMLGSKGTPEYEVRWMAQTGMIGCVTPEYRYLARLHLRLGMEAGSCVDILVQYDSVGEWENLGHLTAGTTRSFTLPVRPRRCDHLRIRLKGKGQVLLYAMTKYLEQGSDIP